MRSQNNIRQDFIRRPISLCDTNPIAIEIARLAFTTKRIRPRYYTKYMRRCTSLQCCPISQNCLGQQITVPLTTNKLKSMGSLLRCQTYQTVKNRIQDIQEEKRQRRKMRYLAVFMIDSRKSYKHQRSNEEKLSYKRSLSKKDKQHYATNHDFQSGIFGSSGGRVNRERNESLPRGDLTVLKGRLFVCSSTKAKSEKQIATNNTSNEGTKIITRDAMLGVHDDEGKKDLNLARKLPNALVKVANIYKQNNDEIRTS
ncbi:hypothetical protein CAPTEDRAFT_210579 [Capitella teleta]|uniref:Uncharacterized protein n=1 Tax=Capitella teleta TaxID=283909 RepID=R7U7T6_CAPTE|nr:hypothetical protein CAPTEDRAFT_210579 [Capitella teleta]|eukprot:ELT99736.1 hypothetical protein CAPTEDRAFT_210579 [Capitella teleta]